MCCNRTTCLVSLLTCNADRLSNCVVTSFYFFSSLIEKNFKTLSYEALSTRAESKYSEQVGVTVEFYGGKLNGINYSDPSPVIKYVRRVQLVGNFELD